MDSIYLDFAKAFDKVDKGILCHKLKSIGISGKLGLFLYNFLSDRKQTVLANGKKSEESTVIFNNCQIKQKYGYFGTFWTISRY